MLQLRDVVAAYGPIVALHGVSLEVPEGKIVTVLGANGAGKSTTLRAISGLLQPKSGTIEFEGQRIDHLSPEEIVSLGMSHIPEGRQLFSEMTVLENLRLGAYARPGRPNFEPGWLPWLAPIPFLLGGLGTFLSYGATTAWITLIGALLSLLVMLAYIPYCIFAYKYGRRMGRGIGLHLELPLRTFPLKVIGWAVALFVPVVSWFALVHLPTICFQQGLRVGSLEAERAAGRPAGDDRLGVAHGGQAMEWSPAHAIREYRQRRRDFEADLKQVFEYFPILAERQKQIAGTLSGGEQQMLAMGRGLMARPRLLLLDEPSMGLAPIVTREIFEIIRAINRTQGVTILLVEQNAKLALEIAHYGYVLETGRIALADTSENLRKSEAVQRSYLGY